MFKVSTSKTYQFRLINGAVYHGCRINIADLKMTFVSADYESIAALVLDEVFLHTAEQFNVEVTIPDDWEG